MMAHMFKCGGRCTFLFNLAHPSFAHISDKKTTSNFKIVSRAFLPVYNIPSVDLQGDACTNSGIVNGNFCIKQKIKCTQLFTKVRINF